MASSPATPPYNQKDGGDLDSDSEESHPTTHTNFHRPLYAHQANKPSNLAPIDTSHALPRPPAIRTVNDLPSRTHSPTVDSPSSFASHFGHHRRQRSQGYFEPTLPSNAHSNMSGLTASQIAAQAAMHVQSTQHSRKRSQTVPEPGSTPPGGRRPLQSSPPPVPSVNVANPNLQYQNGIVGGHRMAATAAANVAFPRSPMNSPGLPPQEYAPSPVEPKPKEKSKMKLFSKPKSIGISKDKDLDKKYPALPSPGKMAMHSTSALNRIINGSTTSLVDPTMSSASSFYSTTNASSSTLVPVEKAPSFVSQPEKKHKHHFLSRQKDKLKDKDDHHNLLLSSASSNSRPTDPSAPQPLYNFAAPSSPGHASTFAQSKSGLDLRHGGKALRQKKKDEKAAAALGPYVGEALDAPFRERVGSTSQQGSDWAGPGSLGSSAQTSLGASPGVSVAYANNLTSLGGAFGIPGLTPDDAWPLLKAKLLHIFERQDLRPPIEDFNALVSVHLRRCVEKRQPTTIIEDLGELLQTGFLSLDQTLRHVPDERLIPALVEMWMFVFTTILPFLQAVFLPLDLEFKGRGPLMTAREAAEFWGATLPGETDPSSETKNIPTLGEELDVRRIVLLTFRDTVILPRNDTLVATFSRLSLDNLSAGIRATDQHHFDPSSVHRPSTAASTGHTLDASLSSYNSQSSTLLDTPGTTSPLRSRATSNTSAGSFPSFGQQSPRQPQRAPPMDGSKVTETVGRMLQCMSVLASVQSGDEAQQKMERLTKELKWNWLGRGRTGRQRRGFVGTRVPRGGTTGIGVA